MPPTLILFSLVIAGDGGSGSGTIGMRRRLQRLPARPLRKARQQALLEKSPLQGRLGRRQQRNVRSCRKRGCWAGVPRVV